MEPLLQLAYTLTPADALAFEVLPRELSGWRKVLFLLWLGGAGVVLALLSPEWTGPEGGWQFWLVGAGLVAVAWLVAAGAMTVRRYVRARRRVPGPVAVTLRQWPDHLEVVVGGRTTYVAYETIAGVTTTAGHVFVTAPPEVVIVPAAAFASVGEMAAFGADVDRLSQQSAD